MERPKVKRFERAGETSFLDLPGDEFYCKTSSEEDCRNPMGKIRIISGRLGGRRISGPPPGVEVRPMFNRVKESLFNILRNHLPGKDVLDLCAGTGSIGIEALSLGARSVCFVEKERRNISVIRENLATLGVEDQADIVQGELPQVLTRVRGKFHIVFIDPPFRSEVVFSILPELKSRNLILADSTLVVQRARRDQEVSCEGYDMVRRHEIGDSELWFLSPSPSTPIESDKL